MSYNIQIWGEPGRWLSLDSEGHLIFSEKEHNSFPDANGFCKEFLWGKALILYMNDKNHWLVKIGESTYSANEVKKPRTQHSFGFTKLAFFINEKSFSFYEFTPFESLSRILDPTYDAFDSEVVFGNWFVSKLRRIKGE